MPCYDSRNEPSYVRAEAKKEFQEDLNNLTRLLCEACKIIFYRRSQAPSDELRKWHEDHLKVDKARSR